MAATMTTTMMRAKRSTGLTVGGLAERVGVRPDTVRFYERIGLLPPADRTPAGYRLYDQSAIDRLLFIQGSQRLGLSLTEIHDLLAVRDTGACPCEPAAPMLQRHISDIDAEMARLAQLRTELVRILATIPGPDCPEPQPGTWRPAPVAGRRGAT
jgi:DNA-binding transcriptional MerR regulator